MYSLCLEHCSSFANQLVLHVQVIRYTRKLAISGMCTHVKLFLMWWYNWATDSRQVKLIEMHPPPCTSFHLSAIVSLPWHLGTSSASPTTKQTMLSGKKTWYVALICNLWAATLDLETCGQQHWTWKLVGSNTRPGWNMPAWYVMSGSKSAEEQSCLSASSQSSVMLLLDGIKPTLLYSAITMQEALIWSTGLK